MAPEEVLKSKPRVVSRQQQESYFENGYLLVDRKSTRLNSSHW